MRLTTSLPLALALTFATAAPSVAQTAADSAGVRTAVATYLRAHATGDTAITRSAFWPTAHIEGIRDGALSSWTVDQYVALFRGVPAPDEATRVRTLDAFDIIGSAAMAKATLKHGATTFTDYFVLLRVGTEWRIANKVYHAQR